MLISQVILSEQDQQSLLDDSDETYLLDPQDPGSTDITKPENIRRGHKAKIVDVKTYPINDAEFRKILSGQTALDPDKVPAYRSGDQASVTARVNYINSVNLIPVNQPDRRTAFATVIKVKVISSGRRDDRSNIYYIFYSTSKKQIFDSINLIIKNLPVWPLGTIGNRQSVNRNFWQVVATSRDNAVKKMDSLKPSQIGNLASRSFGDTPSLRGLTPEMKLAAEEQQQINTENNTLSRSIRNKKSLSLTNIEALVRRQRGSKKDGSYFSKKKTGYLADLLKVFLDNTDSPSKIYPLLLTTTTKFEQLYRLLGIQASNSITTDFMEVVHPIALLTGNCNGNGQDMLFKHFGVNSWQDIKQNARINYPGGTNNPLIDSEVYYPVSGGRGFKKLMISSKKAGGMPPRFTALKTAWNECVQLAPDRWRADVKPRIDNDPKYRAAWLFLEMRLSTREDADTYALIKENLGLDANVPLQTVYDELNKQGVLSELIVWIFNHSATIQVDTFVEEGGGGAATSTDRDKKTILTNIIATWPTQLADTAEIQPEGKQFKIVVDGRKVADLPTPGLSDTEIFRGQAPSTADKKTKVSDYGTELPGAKLLQQIPTRKSIPPTATQASLLSEPSNVTIRTQVQIQTDINRVYQILKQTVDPLIKDIARKNQNWPRELQELSKSSLQPIITELRKTIENFNWRGKAADEARASAQRALAFISAWNTKNQQLRQELASAPATVAPVDPQERQIQNIIALAQQQGKAQDQAKARQEIESLLGSGYSDEDIAYSLTETKSRIMRGIFSGKLPNRQ